MIKDHFKKIEVKFSLYGVIIGFLIIIFAQFVYYTKFGINILLGLMYVPTKLFSFIIPCSPTSLCLYYGVDLMVFISPIYLGLIGFLIGYIIEKIKKK